MSRNRDGETAEEKAISVTMFLQNPSKDFRLTVRHLEGLREKGEVRGGTPLRTIRKTPAVKENNSFHSFDDNYNDRKISLGDDMEGGEGGEGGEGAWTFRGVLHTVGAYFGGANPNGSSTADNGVGGATVAHLGESNRFYYDDTLKRWIDPKEENNEEDVNGNSGNNTGEKSNGDRSMNNSLVQSPSGKGRKKKRRPGKIELPPSDAMLGPTPPPSVTPRHGGGSSSTRSHSPSLEQLAFRATSPPAEVAMALAMANVGDSGKSNPHTSTPEDRPPGWSQREKKKSILGGAAAGAVNKKNRFAMSQRKQGKLRSRYVDTFSKQ